MKKATWQRNAAVFLGSQSISLFGSSLVQFAMTWYITMATQSGSYMTISILCSFVPMVFLSPFAGVWADRYDRKKLIVISDGVIALSTLGIAVLFLMGIQPLWLIFVVQAVRGLGSAVQMPAVSAVIPDMVPEEQLTRINGIYSSVQALLSLVSPALGGVLLSAMASIELIFFIDVATAAIAIFVMMRHFHVPRHAGAVRDVSSGSYVNEMREGVSYVRKHNFLVHMLMYVTVICFMVAPVAFLTPLQIVRSYGEEVWKMTAGQVAFAAGMLGGGLLITVWSGLKNRVHTMAAAIFLMGVCVVLMGAGVPFGLYLTLTALSGFMMPMFNTPATVMLQERVDSAYMGRVFSVISMVNSGLMPLGMLLFGPLADRVSIELLLVLTGSIILLSAVAVAMDRVVRPVGLPIKAKPVPETK